MPDILQHSSSSIADGLIRCSLYRGADVVGYWFPARGHRQEEEERRRGDLVIRAGMTPSLRGQSHISPPEKQKLCSQLRGPGRNFVVLCLNAAKRPLIMRSVEQR